MDRVLAAHELYKLNALYARDDAIGMQFLIEDGPSTRSGRPWLVSSGDGQAKNWDRG